MKHVFAGALLAALALPSFAGGIESLENFIRNAKTGRADFTQVVTGPAREGQAARSKTSSGTFEFQRPDKFRFTYRKPFEQVIVADGKTLWLHDRDLNQVTQQWQSKVLGSTPAALLAASPDLSTLRKDFDLKELPASNGLEWISATPRVKEGQLHSMKAGFRGNDLAALEITDGLGQRSVLTFTNMQVNTAIAAETFRFNPPSGTEIVKQ
jgi:outer membrane lipoprotein carrier protein